MTSCLQLLRVKPDLDVLVSRRYSSLAEFVRDIGTAEQSKVRPGACPNCCIKMSGVILPVAPT